MDIPNSGAIFTLGKSYLAENTQSYFYIKNDPVKRLISGPHQSAVICDSGRLFVWGENHFGQLGIGSNHHSSNNNAAHNDITSKPTCVKSLKVLGVKVRDVAFGNDWSVILTFSNEVFFSGRSIFADAASVTANFITTTILGEDCEVIRKPFRLEEFDNFLSTSEETENFIAILAGSEHFVVLTSFGRLIGWGSNKSHQLGALPDEAVLVPHELKLDAQVQQYACGPESTLVLTTNGKLYLTGQLNDFIFPQFTELQKNLTANEHIMTMHISKASEIFIVTNAGSIYRSFESVRNKSLIFQRFYDYDSEEHGPIWKLLKGFSFYAVLTKANKFFTTFSESGHHLKTFREISKFKNLRLLDMAVGNQHVLVHGIPRSSALSASTIAGVAPNFMGRAFVMLNANEEVQSNNKSDTEEIQQKSHHEDEPEVNGNVANAADNGELENESATAANDSELRDAQKDTHEAHQEADLPSEKNDGNDNAVVTGDETAEQNDNESAEAAQIEATAPPAEEMPVEEPIIIKEVAKVIPQTEPALETMTEVQPEDTIQELPIKYSKEEADKPSTGKSSTKKSPSVSLKSSKSQRSIKFDANAMQKSESSEKLLRPHTPYPDSSSASTTPQTVKKTPLRNFSYETAMEHDLIEQTSPIPLDSLEHIEEQAHEENDDVPPVTALVSLPTPPSEEDEQLVVEINTTTDELNNTVNEIRFINNGVDVTDNVKASAMESEDDDDEENDDTDDNEDAESDNIGLVAKNALQASSNRVVAEINHSKESFSEQLSDKLHDARTGVENAAKRAAHGAQDAVDSVGENVKRVAHDAQHAMESMAMNASKVADDAKQTFMGVADDTKHALGVVSTKISAEMHDAKESLTKMLGHKGANDDNGNSSKELTPSSIDGGGLKSHTEDDERTTASVNSTQTSTGNPFDNNNPFDQNNPFEVDDGLQDIVERSKRALREELEAAKREVVEHANVETEHAKGKVRQFFDDMRAKGKSMSCQSEKAIRIEDEQLPRYSEADELAVVPHTNGRAAGTDQANTSRVCSIL